MDNPVRHVRREMLKLTQAQFAALFNVQQASVSRWETAGRFPLSRCPEVSRLTGLPLTALRPDFFEQAA